MFRVSSASSCPEGGRRTALRIQWVPARESELKVEKINAGGGEEGAAAQCRSDEHGERSAMPSHLGFRLFTYEFGSRPGR